MVLVAPGSCGWSCGEEAPPSPPQGPAQEAGPQVLLPGHPALHTSVPKEGWPWGCPLECPPSPVPRPPRSPSEPCPVTTSRVSAWTFPKTFCASQMYGA